MTSQPARSSVSQSLIQQDQANDEIDLSQLLRTLWRGKFLILLCALVALFIGGWYAFVHAVPVYTSSATVALESRKEQVVDIESVVTGLRGDQATINTEVEVMRSRGLIEKLVDKLDLTQDPEFNGRLRTKPRFGIGALITMIRGTPAQAPQIDLQREMDSVINTVLARITVSNVRQTFVFRVTATTQDPKKSAALANTLAELYILDQLESKFEATEQATDWLTGRVGELQIQLEAAETEVKEFNAGADLVSPEALAGLNRQIKDLRDRLREARLNETTAAARVVELEAAQTSGDVAKMVDVASDQTLNRVRQLMVNSGDSDPDRSAFDARFEQVLTRAQLEVTRAAGQITALQSTITDQESQITLQSADLVELQQLQREAEASRLIYEFFLGRLKETSVQQGIQQADSRMLSRAVVPTGPSAPRKTIILAVSMMLGLFAGSAFILAREFSQTTFRDSTELESRTGYTVIGQIPAIPAKRRKNVLKYLTDKPTSAAAEAIRNLRTSVLLSDIDNPPQIIMSTSSIPGEGKTTYSLAMAQNLTGLGKTVLLVEGDIRRRTFAEYFDIKDKKGLVSVLSGEATLEDAVVHEPSLRADILIGEKTTTNAADLFSSDRFKAFLTDIRKKYDYIIIDTPPVLAVPDARVIGQSVDAVLYTVKWDSTTHRQVREGLKAFHDVNVPVTGLVLSQISVKGMKKYGYGDSYGAYSAYYDN